MVKIITFGTFDVFHVGHLNVIERAKALGTHLTVGVSTDEMTLSKKGRNPVYSLNQRMRIVNALTAVDHVFIEESLEKKREYLEEYSSDILVMGDDWYGKFDDLSDVCKIVYLPRTPAISTTEIIEKIRL